MDSNLKNLEYVTDALTLSQYVVGKCYGDDKPVSTLTLHKMLYLLNEVFCRANDGKRLLFEDRFFAWPYGPLVPEVHRKYSFRWGGRPIAESDIPEIPFTENDRFLVDDGIEFLREKSPYDLVCATMSEGSPWQNVYNTESVRFAEIPESDFIRAALA